VNSDPDPIRIQGFDDQKLKKKYTDDNFFDKNLQFIYVRATEDAFSPQKRTSSTSKNEFYQLFSMFVGRFFLLDPDPRIQTRSGYGP
jgi:hypothetical protein